MLVPRGAEPAAPGVSESSIAGKSVVVNQRPADDDETPDGASSTEFDADLSLAHLRASQAAGRLRRENWEIQRRREDATISSVLLGSRGDVVAAHLSDTSTYVGTVAEVGVDYVALESTHGLTWLALAAVTAVELRTDKVRDADSLDSPSSMLIDVIEDLIAAEVTLGVTLRSATALSGEPIAVGSSLFMRNSNGHGVTVADFGAIAALHVVRY